MIFAVHYSDFRGVRYWDMSHLQGDGVNMAQCCCMCKEVVKVSIIEEGEVPREVRREHQ